MRRVHGVLTALSLAAFAVPTGAAEITRMATAGEKGNPFEIDVSARWDRWQEKATIEHEQATAPTSSVPGGTIGLGERLQYERTASAIVPRIAIGLWHDLEIHFELPYVLADDTSWKYGTLYGNPSGPNPTDPSSIAGNTITAQGTPCAVAPCPLFPVDPKTSVYHGGRTGDLVSGIAWGIMNDRKDDSGPFWLVGLDITAPTAQIYEPGKDRGTDWSSPFSAPAKPGPFGEKIWKFDLYTAFSRRLGVMDPYVKAHVQYQAPSANTYSNCKYAAQFTAAGQMNDLAAANCQAWGSTLAGAQLPWIVGLTVGTEIVPFDDVGDQQKLALDFRLWGDYVGRQRFYNELTDATGKIHDTEAYAEAGALAGLYLRASKFLTLQAQASIITRSPHYLTGESLGKNGSWPAVDANGNPTGDPSQINPNFDWRYDAPGRRFRISEVTILALSFAGVITF
jgi:hypothetical protein